MNNLFGKFFVGFGGFCILMVITMIVIGDPYFPESIQSSEDLDQYIFPIMVTIFPIGGGLFLIFRKKERWPVDFRIV